MCPTLLSFQQMSAKLKSPTRTRVKTSSSYLKKVSLISSPWLGGSTAVSLSLASPLPLTHISRPAILHPLGELWHSVCTLTLRPTALLIIPASLSWWACVHPSLQLCSVPLYLHYSNDAIAWWPHTELQFLLLASQAVCICVHILEAGGPSPCSVVPCVSCSCCSASFCYVKTSAVLRCDMQYLYPCLWGTASL